MIRRVPILLTLFVLLTCALIGCDTGRSTADLESTIVARVVATLESAQTVPAETQPPPEPTAVPAPTGPSVTPPPEIEAEEYAVYAALVQINPINFDLGSPIVVREQTVAGLQELEGTLEQVGPLPAGLVDSYRSRNAAAYTLRPELDLEQDYSLLPQDETAEILRTGGTAWTEFEADYPGTRGMVSFSRVGFDANGDTALVTMGFVCGDLCGSGGLYLLVKEQGTWKVQQALMEWIS
jgi:hypothetical protein